MRAAQHGRPRGVAVSETCSYTGYRMPLAAKAAPAPARAPRMAQDGRSAGAATVGAGGGREGRLGHGDEAKVAWCGWRGGQCGGQGGSRGLPRDQVGPAAVQADAKPHVIPQVGVIARAQDIGHGDIGRARREEEPDRGVVFDREVPKAGIAPGPDDRRLPVRIIPGEQRIGHVRGARQGNPPRDVVMNERVADLRVEAIRLAPPAVIVVELPAVNHVVIAVDIDAVAEAILRGGAVASPSATPMYEDVSNLWICYPLAVREHHQRA